MLSIIIAENLTDAALAENPADDYETLVQSLQGFDLDRAVADTGVSVDDLRQAARLYANTAPATTVYSVRDDDPDGIASLLANLALLTGNVGRAGGGVHLFRPGGGNVQGVYDVTTDPGVDLSSVVEGILAGRVTALYWVGDAPEMNDAEAARFHEAIERVDFLVVQGLVIDDHLAAHADVLLPAAAATEREGTYTNAERRVQRVRPFLLPPGDARPVWEAPAALSRLVGTNADGFSYADASHVFDEIAQSVPLYTGLSYDLLDSSLTGLVRPLT
jgi:predicted molibdopterin-dependent oxidoreductase YjgC